MQFKAKTRLDKAFETGIILKAIDGGIEIIAGILLFFISVAQINKIAIFLTSEELSQDPHDFIANHILQAAHHVNHGSLIFGSAYLLAHGLVKVVLVVEILRGHLWAYPGLIIVTGAFMLYQIYQIVLGHSALIIALTLFDIIIMWLIWHEYQLVRKHINPAVVG